MCLFSFLLMCARGFPLSAPFLHISPVEFPHSWTTSSRTSPPPHPSKSQRKKLRGGTTIASTIGGTKWRRFIRKDLLMKDSPHAVVYARAVSNLADVLPNFLNAPLPNHRAIRSIAQAKNYRDESLSRGIGYDSTYCALRTDEGRIRRENC